MLLAGKLIFSSSHSACSGAGRGARAGGRVGGADVMSLGRVVKVSEGGQ